MADELAELERRGLRRERRPIGSGQGPRVRLRGRELVNFASNDYLNLAGDPRLARAAVRAARRYGSGAGASPLVAGHLPPLRRLERALAAFEGEEAALVFSSGFAANLALISTLAGPEDAVFSDQLNHASLIDGCRLSRAKVHVYAHADPAHLEALLRTEGATARRRVIVTESVFSMDGDFAPLAKLRELARRYAALLVVDEAHATGVLGPSGRGLTEDITHCRDAEGAERRQETTIIRVGTLSKALGAQGGFVSGPRVLIDWLVNRARPYIFSTALAPPACAAAHAALRIAAAEPERRERVLQRAAQLREALRAARFATGPSQCQIVPVIIGAPEAAVALSARLRGAGYLVPAIRPPAVPPGTSRLRISVTAGHTEDDLTGLIAALRRLGTDKSLE
jgi:8-amino-7-oxononanoate synthase